MSGRPPDHAASAHALGHYSKSPNLSSLGHSVKSKSPAVRSRKRNEINVRGRDMSGDPNADVSVENAPAMPRTSDI